VQRLTPSRPAGGADLGVHARLSRARLSSRQPLEDLSQDVPRKQPQVPDIIKRDRHFVTEQEETRIKRAGRFLQPCQPRTV
jgi:hypothetical protein